MAIGVAVANAILLVSFAEQNRLNGAASHDAARAAAPSLADAALIAEKGA
jgi:multidrug efflux pump subunit AcrB